VAGGAGSAPSNECLDGRGLPTRVVNLGLPDRFIEHGDHREQLAQCGLDAAGIRRTILRHAPRKPRAPGICLILTGTLNYYIIGVRLGSREILL